MATWDKPQPYPDDTGVGARLLDMPVMSPEPVAAAPKRKVRASGDPRCDNCRDGHPCDAHKALTTDPLRTIGGFGD